MRTSIQKARSGAPPILQSRRSHVDKQFCMYVETTPRAFAAGGGGGGWWGGWGTSIPARSGRGGPAYQLDRAPKGLPLTQTILYVRRDAPTHTNNCRHSESPSPWGRRRRARQGNGDRWGVHKLAPIETPFEQQLAKGSGAVPPEHLETPSRRQALHVRSGTATA